MTLREHVNQALENRVAVGHFNVSTMDGVWAIADAARGLDLPVIVGVSEGERDYLGVRQIAAVIRSIRKERGQNIFLNADHTYSFERVKEAIDAGFDSVIFDGAQLPLGENIQIAKKCVEYAREYSGRNGVDIMIEGELGYIGKSSEVLDAVPPGAIVGDSSMTKPEDAERFAKDSGVDMLAPAVGNIHGVIRGGDPALNPKRAKEIAEAAGLPLVLHGASGNTAEEVRKCIKAGVAIVHVNTELRMAYRSGLVKSLSEDPEEVAPYKYMKPAKLAMQKVIEEKLKVFNG
ncbi:class II fructose-bisphosphate aldolase family protein [Patescibacteria group bacterium]|nr:class II fructose-bisphosphate aldolase family protein [Patescibacteria group bacterium]MDE1946382.1 class II fructose-bisphosphate aldolase [Patescibacteria group bacterium]MDE2010834.1 class II fructose-bisphosphate aldolase [Patescibacteria group bacterium]MDE2233106.1 class II fructose-bisphosphate aldolase [Patescibacteria group bacterium]